VVDVRRAATTGDRLTDARRARVGDLLVAHGRRVVGVAVGVVDDRVVVVRELAVGRVTEHRRAALVLRPGLDRVAAVARGQEGVLVRVAVVDDVEAERATSAVTPDGVATGDLRGVGALRLAQDDLVAELLRRLLDLRHLGAGHGLVGGDR